MSCCSIFQIKYLVFPDLQLYLLFISGHKLQRLDLPLGRAEPLHQRLQLLLELLGHLDDK